MVKDHLSLVKPPLPTEAWTNAAWMSQETLRTIHSPQHKFQHASSEWGKERHLHLPGKWTTPPCCILSRSQSYQSQQEFCHSFPSEVLDLIPFSWQQIFERNIQTWISFTLRFRMAKSIFYIWLTPWRQFLSSFVSSWNIYPACTGFHRNNILVLDCSNTPFRFACFLHNIIWHRLQMWWPDSELCVTGLSVAGSKECYMLHKQHTEE